MKWECIILKLNCHYSNSISQMVLTVHFTWTVMNISAVNVHARSGASWPMHLWKKTEYYICYREQPCQPFQQDCHIPTKLGIIYTAKHIQRHKCQWVTVSSQKAPETENNWNYTAKMAVQEWKIKKKAASVFILTNRTGPLFSAFFWIMHKL